MHLYLFTTTHNKQLYAMSTMKGMSLQRASTRSHVALQNKRVAPRIGNLQLVRADGPRVTREYREDDGSMYVPDQKSSAAGEDKGALYADQVKMPVSHPLAHAPLHYTAFRCRYKHALLRLSLFNNPNGAAQAHQTCHATLLNTLQLCCRPSPRTPCQR